MERAKALCYKPAGDNTCKKSYCRIGSSLEGDYCVSNCFTFTESKEKAFTCTSCKVGSFMTVGL